MSVPSAVRRPSSSTLLCAAVAVGAMSAVFGCAVGAEADTGVDTAQTTTEPNEPAPGPSLPASSGGDDTGSGGTGGNAASDAGGGGGGTQDAGGTGGGGGGGTAPKATQGDLVISEIMYDCGGTEPLCEWIEVKNLRSAARSLSGLTLEDSGGRTHVIGANVEIGANAYGVLVRNTNGANTAGVPGASRIYAYGDGLTASTGILLGNGAASSITLRDGNVKLAEVVYGGWYSASGASVQLKVLGTTQMTSKGNWCVSTSTWGSGADFGTPGAASDCP